MNTQSHFQKGLYRSFILPVKLTTSLVFFLSLVAFNNNDALGADGDLLWAFDGVGVSQASGMQRIFNMASDGNGGAFFAWEDENAGGIRAQRINSSGTALWLPTDGVVISTTGSSAYVIKSSTGDAIIAWNQPSGIYVQKVNTSGVVQWASGGVQVGTSGESPIMVSDNTGGTFVVWGGAMRVAYIDSSGTIPAPGVDGIALGSSVRLPSYKDISTDGVGGAIVVWADFAKNIVAQRIKAGLPWGTVPTVVSNDVRDEGPVDIDYDGANGVVITWKGSQIFPANVQIRAQRLNSSGTALWTANGVVVVDSTVVGGAQSDWVLFEVASSIATDGAGGAIVAWNDWRNDVASGGNDDVYAQRIDSSGNLLWTANGVLLPPFIQGSTAPGSQRSTKTVSDLNGGAIVTYNDRGGWSWDISATRLNAAGDKTWSFFVFTDSFSPSNPGVSQYWPDIVYDGSGTVPLGAIIGWADNGIADVFAQKIEVSPPANDDCSNALPVTEGSIDFSTFNATTDGPDEPACTFFQYTQVGSDIWYRYFASCTGTATVSLCGSKYDTKLAVYGSTCPTVPGLMIACNDDSCGFQSEVSFLVTQGSDYLIRIGGFQDAQGLGSMTITTNPGDLNDDCREDYRDFALVGAQWQATNCVTPTWCGRADINHDGSVNLDDLSILSFHWLGHAGP